MRPLIDMDTIQIEVTNACHLDCGNCTRFCGHHRKPYMMDLETVEKALTSLQGFPKMVGIMGGEPLLHPKFAEICELALSKFPRAQLGLWTSFPKGKEKYAEQIAKTFGNIFLNDHTRNDVFHAPILIGMQEITANPRAMWTPIDHCWVQNCWSASINPKGAWFCEIAASMSMLFGDGDELAWPVEPGWWWRTPKDFREQMEHFCPRCGMAAPLQRRPSINGLDDISPLNFEALKDRSRKIKRKKVVVGKGQIVPEAQLNKMASYKDMDYRQRIAARYGMYLTLTQAGFWEPHMGPARRSLYSMYKEKYMQG